MLKKLYSGVKEMLGDGHERSIKARKNIVISFFMQGISILIGFLIVPITLHYLDIDRYGIWLTITSTITWFSFFDIGLGNGLRNKLAEAFAVNDLKLARVYVSTTYALILFIMMILLLAFFICFNLINWSYIFNAPASMQVELSEVVFFIFCFFCIQFIFNLINVVLNADQKPATNTVMRVISSVLTLIITYILTKTTHASLLYFTFAFSGSTTLILVIANVLLFNTRYKFIAPSWRCVEFKHVPDLLSLGFTFFVIQLSSIILFSTDNLIITQLFGPAEVAPYNIAFKYFGMITLVFGIINTPFWSAYTEAYAKNDFLWIMRINRKLKKVWLILSVLSLVLLLISPLFYHYWIGDQLKIPFLLSVLMCVYVIIMNWGSIFVYFVNGVGKIKLQFYISIAAALINIPLSVFFAKVLHCGPAGVIMSTIICLSFGPLVAPIQYKKIIRKKATGIWDK